jgi:hypothetical protein
LDLSPFLQQAESSHDDVDEQIQLAKTIKDNEALVEAWKNYTDAIEVRLQL